MGVGGAFPDEGGVGWFWRLRGAFAATRRGDGKAATTKNDPCSLNTLIHLRRILGPVQLVATLGKFAGHLLRRRSRELENEYQPINELVHTTDTPREHAGTSSASSCLLRGLRRTLILRRDRQYAAPFGRACASRSLPRRPQGSRQTDYR